MTEFFIPNGGLAMLHKKNIIRRIDSVLAPDISRRSVQWKTAVLFLTAALLFTAAVSLFAPKIPLPALAQENSNKPVSQKPATGEKHQSVKGVIKNIRQEPVAGAKVFVQLFVKGTNEDKLYKEYIETTQTGGSFNVDVSAEDAQRNDLLIQISAAHPDYIATGFTRMLLADYLQQYNGLTQSAATLLDNTKVSGTVLMPDGKPADGVIVYAVSPDDGGYIQTLTRTGSSGKFTVGTVNSKNNSKRMLYILPDNAAPFLKELDANENNLQTVKLEYGSIVVGRALDGTGQPVKNLWVSLMHKGPATKVMGHAGDDRAAVSDEEGYFVFHPVLPGNYKIVPDVLMEHSWHTPKKLPPETAHINLFPMENVPLPK
jgi:hypothetical protein